MSRRAAKGGAAAKELGGPGLGEQKLAALKADPANPRSITPEAMAGLGASMETFGDVGGIVFNRRLGSLVSGHQRLRNLVEAGAAQWSLVSETEGFIVHPETGERFPVRIVDWDEATHRAASLSANNPAISGTFDHGALDKLLAALEGDRRFAQVGLDSLRATTEAILRQAEEEKADLLSLTPPGGADEARSGVEVGTVEFGIESVPATDEELAAMSKLTMAYSNRHGKLDGFVAWLLQPRAQETP